MAGFSFATYYNGRSRQREYSSFLALVYESGARVAYTAKHLLQVFTFVGVPDANAFTEVPHNTPIEVVDISGTRHNVSIQNYLSETSGGYAPFIHEQVDVERTPMSPRLWVVTVSRTCSELYRNGVLQTAQGQITPW